MNDILIRLRDNGDSHSIIVTERIPDLAQDAPVMGPMDRMLDRPAMIRLGRRLIFIGGWFVSGAALYIAYLVVESIVWAIAHAVRS